MSASRTAFSNASSAAEGLRGTGVVLVVATVAAIAVGVDAAGSSSALLDVGVPLALTPLALWLFLSSHYERTLAAVLVYLACVDGVVKLSSGSSVATLGRDVVLYAIVLGALLRLAIRREPIRIPLWGGFVFAWYAVVLAQVANPNGVSLVHSIASLRPHLEFVPLFFLAFVTMRTERRLWLFLLLLVIVAAANGVVGLIQLGLTPNQLGSWGPGYHLLVYGGGVRGVGETLASSTGKAIVRPPGLGGFSGFGGQLGSFATIAAVAILAGGAARHIRVFLRVAVGLLALLGIAAVLTSQARSAILGTVIGLIAFLALTVTSKKGLRVFGAVAVGAVVAAVLYSTIVPSNANHYAGGSCRSGCSVAPSQLGGTITKTLEVHGTLALIPQYLVDYPLGAGLGQAGAGASSSIGASDLPASQGYNGESEFTYLIVETGIPGLLVIMGLTIVMVRAVWRLRSVADPAIQRPLMALGAVLVIMIADWPFGAVTAAPPAAPMFWALAGTLAYWTKEARSGRLPMSRKLSELLVA
jgi:hypothetical protein